MEITIQNKNSESSLVKDIIQLIANARIRVAAVASAGIATLYWHIGERINREVLGNQRAAEEHWTKRTLRAKIDGMLFERTAISDKPKELIRKELASLRNERKMSPDIVFKSPYF